MSAIIARMAVLPVVSGSTAYYFTSAFEHSDSIDTCGASAPPFTVDLLGKTYAIWLRTYSFVLSSTFYGAIMAGEENPNQQLVVLLHAAGTAMTQMATKIGEMQTSLANTQKTQAQFIRASYQAHTACGKSRLVAELVREAEKDNPSTARAEVAKLLQLSPSRISQLLNSDKNRKNGK
jgi:hypothetical protein